MQLDDERYVVTGGAGFIGAHLTRTLLGRGSTVHVIDDLSVGSRDRVPAEATVHDVDVRDDELEPLLAEIAPSTVFHLAARHYIPQCNANPEETFEINVMGTRNLLRAGRGLGSLDRVVYASTAAVYPPRETAHAPEDEPGPMDIYGRTKLVGEDLLREFGTEAGVSTVAARLFNVFGPEETNPHLVPAILEQLEDGRPRVQLGNLTPRRDLVHVDDVVRALLRMAHEDRRGHATYNVGTGSARSVEEVVDAVARALGTDIEIVQDPDRVRESDRPHLEADTERIQRELGWQPKVEFVDGLRGLLEAEGITQWATTSS
jgi:UDP-glucose 4-epimerase